MALLRGMEALHKCVYCDLALNDSFFKITYDSFKLNFLHFIGSEGLKGMGNKPTIKPDKKA